MGGVYCFCCQFLGAGKVYELTFLCLGLVTVLIIPFWDKEYYWGVKVVKVMAVSMEKLSFWHNFFFGHEGQDCEKNNYEQQSEKSICMVMWACSFYFFL